MNQQPLCAVKHFLCVLSQYVFTSFRISKLKFGDAGQLETMLLQLLILLFSLLVFFCLQIIVPLPAVDHSEVFFIVGLFNKCGKLLQDQFKNLLEFFKVRYYVEFSSLMNFFWNHVIVFDLNLMLVYTMHTLKSISNSQPSLISASVKTKMVFFNTVVFPVISIENA